MTRVLVIGSGGREHALAWALSRSSHVAQVYVAPGNAGTTWSASHGMGLSPHAASQSVPIAVTDFEALIAFAREHQISLTVVGPEIPLAEGIVDAFQAAALPIFGPNQAATQLEASKAFAKDLMIQQGIPTAEFFVTDDAMVARRYLEEHPQPLVIKASGLAAGKGVIITDSREEAGMAIHQIMQQRIFGAAGDLILLEERLYGRELSLLAFCDGRTVKPMVAARDHKRALDGDLGLNTGGMGAIAPADDISPALIEEITQRVLQPAVDGMAALGTPYVGILYAGIMLTDSGIQTLEFNCRFGDPEAQVLLPLLKSDLYEVLMACIDGRLDEIDLAWHDASCATVVLASEGYPESYPTGREITGLDRVSETVIVFHAGTAHHHGAIVTQGGRVLAVTGLAPTLETALTQVYQRIGQLHFDGMHYRRDIGKTLS